MPIKLMVRVRPGVELTCAIFWPSRELIRLDFPTLERPRKANSGGPSGGKNLGSAADVRNLAMGGFICFCRCAFKPLKDFAQAKVVQLLWHAVRRASLPHRVCAGVDRSQPV